MFKDVFIVDANYKMLLGALGMSHKRLSNAMSTILFECNLEEQKCCATVDNNTFGKLIKHVKREHIKEKIPRLGDHMLICLFNVNMLADLTNLSSDANVKIIRSIFFGFHNIRKKFEESGSNSQVDLLMMLVYANRFYEECGKNIDRLIAANHNTLELSQIKRLYKKITQEHLPNGKREIAFLEYTLGCLVSASVQVDVLIQMKHVDRVKVAVLQVLLKKYNSLLERAGNGNWSLETDDGIIEEVDAAMCTTYNVLDEMLFADKG